jgi:hypothetical protein
VSKKIQVTVTVKLEVDMEEWSAEFGLDPKDAVIREDVKAFVGTGVSAQLELLEMTETKVKAWF